LETTSGFFTNPATQQEVDVFKNVKTFIKVKKL